MKVCQILMQLKTNILTCFHPHCEDWELVPGHFIISMKWFYNVGNVTFLSPQNSYSKE